MASWRLVIATPTMPFPPYETAQEQHIQHLVETAQAHDATVTLIAPRTQTAISRAGHLLVRSKFLLRPVTPGDDPKRREIITSWIEPPSPGPSRFLLEHPWFTDLDQQALPAADAPKNVSTAWALWTSAFFSLLSQLNYEIALIHALGWQTSLVPPMARCITGWPSRAATVFSPGGELPPEQLDPAVRALLRLPQEPPSPTATNALLAWALVYASAWDISPEDYQHLAADPELAPLLNKYRHERLLPREQSDTLPEALNRPTIERYAKVLAVARARDLASIHE